MSEPPCQQNTGQELEAVRNQMRMAIRNNNAEISDEDVKLYNYARTNTERENIPPAERVADMELILDKVKGENKKSIGEKVSEAATKAVESAKDKAFKMLQKSQEKAKPDFSLKFDDPDSKNTKMPNKTWKDKLMDRLKPQQDKGSGRG